MLANSSKNFKNIAKTLAVRQQYRQASVYFSGIYETEEVILPQVVKSKVNVVEDLCDNDNSILSKINEFMDLNSIVCDNIREIL